MPTTPVGSSAFAVKSALADALATLPELATVEVTYGGDPRSLANRVVYLGTIAWADNPNNNFISANSRDKGEQWASIGNLAKEENYSIELIVDIQSDGVNDKDIEEETFTIFSAIELYLRQNCTISYGKLTQFQIIPVAAQVIPLADGGRESQIVAAISVLCRK